MEITNTESASTSSLLGEIAARKEDLGFLSRLRRGLNPITEEQAWPILARKMEKEAFADEVRRRIWLTVSGLAAVLVRKNLMIPSGKSVGWILRDVHERRKSSHENKDKKDEDDALMASPSARRLNRILNCEDVVELCPFVIDVVRMAADNDVPVDCHQLYEDLVDWNSSCRDEVRIRWTSEFYRNRRNMRTSMQEGTDE